MKRNWRNLKRIIAVLLLIIGTHSFAEVREFKSKNLTHEVFYESGAESETKEFGLPEELDLKSYTLKEAKQIVELLRQGGHVAFYDPVLVNLDSARIKRAEFNERAKGPLELKALGFRFYDFAEDVMFLFGKSLIIYNYLGEITLVEVLLKQDDANYWLIRSAE